MILHRLTVISRPLVLLICVFIGSGLYCSSGTLGQETAGKNGKDAPPPFELDQDVSAVLSPLFGAIQKAPVTRATVELAADTIVDGAVVSTQSSTYQIASQSPRQFTIYLKEKERRTRIYNDGKSMVVALAPDAFVKMPKPTDNQSAVFSLPIPMGPYPEALLALTLAGADPVLSLATGMKSVEIVDRKKFRGRTDAIHLRGIQDDDVKWDLWVTNEKNRKPLRLVVDLTPMLRANGTLDLPKNYLYQLRFDFMSWRATGIVDTRMFQFQPAANAKEYASVQEYYDEQAEEAAKYALLGKPAPVFTSKTASGKDVHTGELKGKVLVLDFWASWSDPSLQTVPIIQNTAGRFKKKGVVYLPINVGENAEAIAAHLKKHDWEFDSVLDVQSKITQGYGVQVIPMSILVDQDGLVQAAYIGPNPETLAKQLAGDLDSLVAGKKLASKND